MSEREKEGGKVVLALLVGLVLLLGGGYAAAYAGAADHLPRGTSIAGVDVGGLTEDEALVALREGLADRAQEPIAVSVDGRRSSVTPAQAGLAVDYEASVAAAGGGRSWEPGRLWDHYTGGDEIEAVVTVDEQKMADAVDRLVADAGTLPKDGAVAFTSKGVEVTQPVPGEEVSTDETRAALEAAYLDEGATAELALHPAAPDIDDADVQKALDDFANPAYSGPITFRFDSSEVRLTPARFAPALRLVPVDGELEPALRRQKLLRLVDSTISKDGAPVDAGFRIVDGRPRVVPDKPGVGYEPDDLGAAFLEVVTKPEGKREQEVEATVEQADFTADDARALGITERVSTFTTYYPYAEYRNTNIGRAGELINGTILEPGETFSLNDTVGERTRENGFTEGFVISDGIFKEELGGGVSQMATTTFNAMFFAGLEDVEHKPHSLYIDRYPVGREATVVWGSVDLRFRNDTKYGVYITAHVTPSTPSTQGVVTVSMYSTKVWDITSTTSDRYNYTEEKTRTLRTEDCYPNDGYPGFEVDVTRYFRKPGSDDLDHSEVFHTTYIPSDTVVCKPPKR